MVKVSGSGILQITLLCNLHEGVRET